jgi:uncharacterized protein YPO0396
MPSRDSTLAAARLAVAQILEDHTGRGPKSRTVEVREAKTIEEAKKSADTINTNLRDIAEYISQIMEDDTPETPAETAQLQAALNAMETIRPALESLTRAMTSLEAELKKRVQ